MTGASDALVARRAGYRPLSPRALAASVALGISFVAGVVDVITPGSSMEALQTGKGNLGEAWAILGIGVVQLVTFFVFCHRAAANARALVEKEKSLRFTPFTTVAWFFIPIASFYMPYRALKEAWVASAPTSMPHAPPRSLLAWWIVFWLTLFADDRPTTLGFVGIATHLAFTVGFVWLAHDLARTQARRHDELRRAASGAPTATTTTAATTAATGSEPRS